MNVDPQIQLLAGEFIRDLVSEVGRAAVEQAGPARLQDRLAKAMQQAVEDEYAALVEELKP